MSRVIGIILARMGSSRLPGKSLAAVVGKPMITHLVERLMRVPAIERVVVATPDTVEDEPLQATARMAGAGVFAGSVEDVLDRLYQAARAHGADVIVHIGGDCPFVDPDLAQRAVDLLVERGADYACNILPLTYPGGLDVDAVRIDALERAWNSATLRTTRRHPVAYIHQNRDEFLIVNFAHEPVLGHLRWTLDYPEDLAFVRAVYQHLYRSKPTFGMADILRLLEEEPEIGRINAHLSQFTTDQPAYWDSEGYLADLRLDLATVVAEAVAADTKRDLATAGRKYVMAGKLLDELRERALNLAKPS